MYQHINCLLCMLDIGNIVSTSNCNMFLVNPRIGEARNSLIRHVAQGMQFRVLTFYSLQ